MGRANFEKLRVYRLSEELSDDIWEIVEKWPNLARDTLGKQAIRSADRIGANIAEGSGRNSFADNRRFVFMARGSLYETIHWMRRAFKRGLLSDGQIDRIKCSIDNLSPMINAYLKGIGRKSSERATPHCPPDAL
jgi:four helix bundle protein